MPKPITRFSYPENADRYYRIAAGRGDDKVLAQNRLALAFDDGSDDEITRIGIIPRDPVPSLFDLDISDAFRWMAMLDIIREVADAHGWGPHSGFRLDLPVHPPYQRAPWLCITLTRNAAKQPKPGADESGYTRDIGHFAEIVELRRRVQVIWSNDDFMVFDNLEEEDNDDYDLLLMGIPRQPIESVMDEGFTMQHWLSMAGGLCEAAARLDCDAFTAYMNVRPPYQHTPWAHVHLRAGGKALRKVTKADRRADARNVAVIDSAP